jgi:hypothetical protein
MSRTIRICTLIAVTLAFSACGDSPTGPSAASCSPNSRAAECLSADYVNPHGDYVNPHG